MTGFTFRPARREGVGLFVALAGASGSGKSFSALRLARGIAGPDGRIAAIDTEARRMSHYSDMFQFDVSDMAPPFRPERFAQAAKAAEDAGYAVLIIDSFSLEWTGEGGILSWHDEELQRMAGDDYAKRERAKMAAWIKPKMAHKAMIGSFLQRRIPIIFCLRAEDKVGIGPGNKPVSLGWTPIGDPRFLFELTTSITLAPDAPGRVNYALPHKVQEQHRGFLPDGRAITEDAGTALAAWARGETPGQPAPREPEKKPAASDFWSRDDLTIPVKSTPDGSGSDWAGWHGRIVRAVGQAPTVEALDRLAGDNAAGIAGIGRDVPPAAASLAEAIEARRQALAQPALV